MEHRVVGDRPRPHPRRVPVVAVAVPGALLIGEFLQVSFQRFPAPADGVVHEPPRSWGALPVAVTGSDAAIIPLESGEAIWIGLSVPRAETAPRAVCVHVTATMDAGTRVDVLSGLDGASADAASGFLVPPTTGVEGIPRSDGGKTAIVRVAAEASHARGIRDLQFVAVPARALRAPEPERSDLPLHSLALGGTPSRSTVVTCDERTTAGEWDPSRRASVTVTLVAGSEFAKASGLPLPGPLDTAQSYRGWRLP